MKTKKTKENQRRDKRQGETKNIYSGYYVEIGGNKLWNFKYIYIQKSQWETKWEQIRKEDERENKKN